MMERLRVKEASFTLIELLIVIAIIAILIGAMVPVISVTRKDARFTKVMADMEAIKKASQMYHIDTGQWPPAVTAIRGFNSNYNGVAGWNGPYLDDESASDPWGNNYGIWNTGGGMTPRVAELKSYGPDGVWNTTDDIVVIITSDRDL